jgi:hypothetical protein
MRISIVAVVVGLMLGQTATQPYVGTWTAATAGTTFVRIELTMRMALWVVGSVLGIFK